MANAQSRTSLRNRSAKGNVLTVSIPGLKRPIDIEFPDGKLPVCQRCKKIYKTRELCRIRDRHNDIPWNTTYLCVSFDDSCLALNRMGELCLVDEERSQRRFTAQLLDEPPLPLRHKMIHEEDKISPICAHCKNKNYTKHHCRTKQEHTQLPWVTMYVMLSAIHHYDPTEQMNTEVSTQNGYGVYHDATSVTRMSKCGVPPGDKSAEKAFVDNIHRVHPSRSCHLTINSTSTSLRWLEIDPCVPRTQFKSIESFTGIPPMMNRQFGGNQTFAPIANSAYCTSGPPPAYPGIKFGHQGHGNDSYHHYRNWMQSAEYQGMSLSAHSQAPPGTQSFCQYPSNQFNEYQYQQIEHDMRQSFASGYDRQQFSPENNPNSVSQGMNNSDYYNRVHDYSAPPPPSPMSTGPCLNGQYSNNLDQQENRGAPWSHMAMKEDAGNPQGRLLSMGQSSGLEPPACMYHSEQTAHSTGSEMPNQSLHQEENPSSREYMNGAFIRSSR